MCLFSLKGHVCVSYFGNWREVEDACEQEDEDCDRQVHPLDVFEGLDVIRGLEEENVAAKNRCHNGANAVEGLRYVDSEFGVAGWTADWQWLDSRYMVLRE